MLNLEMLNLETVYHCRSHGGPKGSPYGVSLSIPWGAQGPPYGVSLSWFLFIHLVVVGLGWSSSGFSYHVGLLLSRLAFVAQEWAKRPPAKPPGRIRPGETALGETGPAKPPWANPAPATIPWANPAPAKTAWANPALGESVLFRV